MTRTLTCLDFISYYPNIKKSTVRRILPKLIIQSQLSYPVKNWKQLSKVVKLLSNKRTIRRYHLQPIIPARTLDLCDQEQPVSLAYLDCDELKCGLDKWTWKVNTTPTDAQLRALVAVFMMEITCWIMSNHTYMVGQDVFKQDDGAPIGLELAQVIGMVLMIDYDRELRDSLNDQKFNLQLVDHSQYEDDNTLITDTPTRDLDPVTLTRTTTDIIKVIADNIHDGIKVETDHQYNNSNHKVAILDMWVWIDEFGKVRYEFYRKPMAYKGVIHSCSGVSISQKRQIIFSEGLRRLKCCQPSLNWDTKIDLLNQLSAEMYQAGYSQNFRQIMLNRILHAYIKLLRDHDNNISMYREPKNRQTDQQWFSKLGYKASLNVPTTENSELAKLIQTKLKSKGQNIKVTESAGPSITRSLQRSNPNPPANCGRQECAMCLNGNSNYKCFKPKIGYRFVCNMPPCNQSIDMDKISTLQLIKQLSTKQPTHPPAVYEGQSHRSSFSRNLGHFRKYKAKNKASWMWRHNLAHHGGKIRNYKTDFKYKLLTNHKFLISKHCSEGWRQSIMEELQQKGKLQVLNSKLDFTRPFMRHLTMQTGSANTGTGQQQPHSSRPVFRPRQMPNRSKQTNKVIPLKTKSKSVKFNPGPFRNQTGPFRRKAGPFRTSIQTSTNQTDYRSSSDSSDNQKFQKTETGRQKTQTDNSSQSILISSSDPVILSQAKPRRAEKRRASTPVNESSMKKTKFNNIITLSPIKEPSNDE